MNIRNSFGALVLSAAALTAIAVVGTSQAAALSNVSVAHPAAVADEAALETVQYQRGYGPRGYGPGPRAYGPRPYGYGPPRAYGGWGYRPWYGRPYYGTIIGGIALGAIIGATAYGLAPRPPRPDLCWYWADQIQSQGYWDYC